ncbi:hypothetical protein [Micromonospora coerulea]|uniref:hypothetical protein n=1 Tax=Micromonospora coerulea TaxID=47856 RepID=UPI001904F23E|nr:hypothetical protein [Micromonospora veneta]
MNRRVFNGVSGLRHFGLAAALTVAAVTAASPAAASDTEPALPPALAPITTLYSVAPCDPNGPTTADGALATDLNSKLNADMAGYLTAYRVSCAREVVEAVRARGFASRAAVIAIATVIVETHLQNIDEMVDHTSLGLFQQQDWWGTREQRLNPDYATGKFLQKMVELYPNGSWASAPIGTVCQKVQVSAYPDKYQVQAADAQIIVDALWAPAPQPSYALSGDWFRTGEFTPAVVQRSGSVWEWNIKRSQSGGAADVKFTYGDADMVPVAGDWDGDGDWTPGVVANESNSRRWYLKNSLAGGVSDVNFLYGGKDYIPVAGDWDGNGTFTPGVVSRDNGAWKWELRNANSGGAVSATLRYGNSNTWPVAGDWDGNLTWTPAVVDDTDGPRRWFLKNDLGTDGLADVQFNYGSHGTYPVPGNWNGATAATEPGIVENFESRVWRWYLKNSVSGGTADEYFDYGNDAPYPYPF